MFDRILYFKEAELDSPDAPGSGSYMDIEFILRLDCLRGAMGKPFNINSGFRTVEHNRKVGGAENSPHRKGMAADISTIGWTKEERAKLISLALALGFTGYGIGRNYIHLDTMKRYGFKPVAWRYSSDGTRPKVEIEHMTQYA